MYLIRPTGDRVPKPQTTFAVGPLDKSGFVPLYYQIQQTLMEKIQSSES